MKNGFGLFKRTSRLSAFLLGLVTLFAFAPFFFWPVLAVSYGGLLALLNHEPTAKRAFPLGLAFGAGMFISCFHWLYAPVYTFASAHLAFTDAGLHALAIVIMALFALSLMVPLGAAAWLFKRMSGRVPLAAHPWLFAACMLLAEGLRGFPLWPFLPWNYSGYAWANNLNLIQVASIGGVWLLSFLVIGIAASFVGKRSAAVGVAALALCFGFGVLRLQAAPPMGDDNGETLIRLVHVGYGWQQSRTQAGKLKIFLDHYGISGDPVADGRSVGMLIWPEGSVRYSLKDEPGFRHKLETLAPEMLFGSMDYETKRVSVPVGNEKQHTRGETQEIEQRVYYGVAGYKPAGGAVAMDASVRKRIIVPFSEKLPLDNLLKPFYRQNLPRFAGLTADAGKPPFIETAFGRALILNCYEAIFSRMIWRYGAAADYVVHLSNDAWFADSWAPEQFYYITRVRAVEAGKPLIRAANNSVSGLFDGYGRVIYRFDAEEIGMAYDMQVDREALASPGSVFTGVGQRL